MTGVTGTSANELGLARERLARASWLPGVPRRYLAPVGVLAALALIWQFIVARFVQSYILPPPSSIFATAWDERTDLFSAAKTTFFEVAVGFAVAVAVGAVIAVAISQWRTVRTSTYPLVVASQTVPVIAIAPLLTVWFGFGIMPKVLIVTIIAFFPVVVNTVAGMSSIDKDMILLMRSFKARRWDIFWRVKLPGSLPYFFTGVRQAAVLSVIGAVIGEWVGGTQGIGQLMLAANSIFGTARLFAAILYLSVMAIALFLAVVVIERLVIPWHFLTTSREG